MSEPNNRGARRFGMRWFRVRKAPLDPALRLTFERYGVVTMQTVLATTNYIRHKGSLVSVSTIEDELLAWLTEQYDTAERLDTWHLAMEAAITVLVLAELVVALVR